MKWTMGMISKFSETERLVLDIHTGTLTTATAWFAAA